MKALEILKNHIIDLEGMVNIFDEYAMLRTRDETKKAIVELNEAIKELEDLENRSCEDCKSFQFWSETKDISSWDSHWIDLGICNNGVQSGCFNSTIDKDFYCNRWESKQ